MIIHEIDIDDILALESKNDPPISRHRNRPMPPTPTLERMQPKSRQRHPLRAPTAMKCNKNTPQAIYMMG
jgi:hypothetical protein